MAEVEKAETKEVETAETAEAAAAEVEAKESLATEAAVERLGRVAVDVETVGVAELIQGDAGARRELGRRTMSHVLAVQR